MVYFSFSEAGFEKFFPSRMWNYIGKLKMIKWKRFRQTVKMNELFSPATFASHVFFLFLAVLLSMQKWMFLKSSKPQG